MNTANLASSPGPLSQLSMIQPRLPSIIHITLIKASLHCVLVSPSLSPSPSSNYSSKGLRLSPLSVHVGEHHRDVRGKEVVHLVAEAGLTEKPASSNETTDGDVEIVRATAPVGDFREWMGGKNFLQKRKDCRQPN